MSSRWAARMRRVRAPVVAVSVSPWPGLQVVSNRRSRSVTAPPQHQRDTLHASQ
jgi:hypothetical protein